MHRAYARDVRGVLSYANELARVTAEHGFTDHQAKSLILKGWGQAVGDDLDAGLRMLQEGIARQRDIGTEEDFPVYMSLLGEVLIRAGRADEAVAQLKEAHEAFADSGLKVMVPDMLRVLAEATAASDPTDENTPRAWLAEATRMAEAHGANFLSLRIALSAARLDLRRGGTRDAATALARARGAVEDDDQTPEIAEAAELLARYRQDAHAVGGFV
jgi:predicted ATPase